MKSSEMIIAAEQDDRIIVLRQLPIIEERLALVKQQIEDRLKDATALPCTEDNLQEVKRERAVLRKLLDKLEEQRKAIKQQVMEPYESFMRVYEDCISEPFDTADCVLKEKIDAVTNSLLDAKRKEVETYFDEYCLSLGIDFVGFDRTGIKITQSESQKKLRDRAKAFADSIADGLSMINTDVHRDEILVEYKQCLNVSRAVTTVRERHKAMEAEKARQEQHDAQTQALKQAEDKVDAVIDTQPIAPPTETPDKPEVFEMAFAVCGTLDQLREIKKYLEDGGYDYVKLTDYTKA